MFSTDDIGKEFLLPIELNLSKHEIDKSTKIDLELTQTQDVSGLYSYVFNPTTKFGEIVMDKYSNNYTNDTEFIKDTQNSLIDFSFNLSTKDKSDELLLLWSELKNDSSFLEKYQYIDIEFFKFLNNNSKFLQFLSIFNLASPVLSLVFPIIMLIIPFFLIKFNDSRVTFSEYFRFLKIVVMRNSIGNLIFNFGSVTFDKKIYLCLSAGLYLFQIYQNIVACRRFYLNIRKIHEHLFLFRDHVINTITNIDNHLLITDKYNSYSDFNLILKNNKIVLTEFLEKIQKITPYKMDTKKLSNIGYLMKCYYLLFDDERYNKSLLFSFGFSGYTEIISNLQVNINNHVVNKCEISNENINKPCKFTNAYYPPLIKSNAEIVKNTYSLKKNKIITGPNASGKTTLLKTTLFNIILSQQIGFGFYDKAFINPYDLLHCYLNIPDTSGRDSLFQAESRRCKDILEILENNKTKRHFCIFDELYSGTNPYEAVSGAYGYLDYLSKYKNFNFILTTHYVELCNKLNDSKCIENNHMVIDILDEKENNKLNTEFVYTYKLDSGISKIKGGTKVFKDLKYPEEIINIMIKNL